MSKRRLEIWLLGLVVAGVGLLVVFVSALFAYMSATATPLHADAKAVPSVVKAAPAPKWAAAVERGRQLARSRLTAQNLPGLSIAVGMDGEIVWAEGYGWVDLADRRPVGPDTRFRIGTASTPLTSAAVGLLLERGRLKLDDTIQTSVPAFPEKEWPVTLRQVMGHMAGIRSDGGDEGPLLSARCERPVEGLQAFIDRPLLFQPGSRYQYSNYGWILVSAAVESAADQPFLTFMQEQVFEPLGMRDTRADAATDAATRTRATSYFPRFAADPRYGPDPMRPIDYSCYAGASVFVSTPSDLVRFGIAIGDGKLLQPATVALLQTPQRLASGEATGYGLGWDVETVTLAGKPARWVGHEGKLLGGMASSLITFPERRLVVAVVSNTSYADTETLAVDIAQAFAAATTGS